MIVSHKYRFIFIKTRKVGGTSVEIALSKFLGEGDIVTPIVDEDERIRERLGYPGARNYRVPFGEMAREVARLSGAGRRYGRHVLKKKEWPLRFFNHIAASEVKAALGNRVWNDYFKFSIERNSFDKACSFYFWERKTRSAVAGASFRDFVLGGNAARASDFNLYSIGDMPAMDRIVRYENMLAELDEIGARLRLPEPISQVMEGINAKAGVRRGRAVSDLYDADTRRVIEIQYAREIAYFGYRFPQPAEAAQASSRTHALPAAS
jgi:hypothetical protein